MDVDRLKAVCAFLYPRGECTQRSKAGLHAEINQKVLTILEHRRTDPNLSLSNKEQSEQEWVDLDRFVARLKARRRKTMVKEQIKAVWLSVDSDLTLMRLETLIAAENLTVKDMIRNITLVIERSRPLEKKKMTPTFKPRSHGMRLRSRDRKDHDAKVTPKQAAADAYIVVSLGGDDVKRYQCLINFVKIFKELQSKEQRDSPKCTLCKWKLFILLDGGKHANQYANELKQWDVVVQRVKLKHIHEYCLERYFIHKYNPGSVQRWLVLDSHYAFKRKQYKQLAKIVRKWVESGKPFYAHRCPRTTLYTDRRPYNGGCFGSTLNLFQMYVNQVPGYQEMVAERARSKQWYGVDEEFLRLMMIHYLGSERSEKDNVQTGPKPAGKRLLD